MSEKIFLAGATGVIGSVLVKLLVNAGYTVYGSTRREDRAESLRSLGAIPIIVDVFNVDGLKSELVQIKPTYVVHQLTDLPRGLDPSQMAKAIARNAKLRNEGTANLVEATQSSGCTRIVAQSIAWAYAAGSKPYIEEDALDLQAEGLRRISVSGIAALERNILDTPSMNGTVLRYGHLYGPGTGTDQASGASPLHVEAAAFAALLAVQLDVSGVYNIAEDNSEVCSEKAKRVLEWSASLRLASRNLDSQ
ncbi:MAG: NAD(P)-dependent oxidoreductase [Pseudomonadota bacterium]|jgi:nucleoside-diphosphate-sugar epimerase|uniref:NAD-dependent epimerase/dehydratase family protein n=1 Tax=Pseudomonas sp. TaxID=306 RepID=UPI00272BE4D1|nr:NAD(P)-dependent oxidoreductase [Pseudomonas sp.]MDQ3599526.1 NAD(P)-dependent oxidoreductase [Pseudomonadota bacterium]